MVPKPTDLCLTQTQIDENRKKGARSWPWCLSNPATRYRTVFLKTRNSDPLPPPSFRACSAVYRVSTYWALFFFSPRALSSARLAGSLLPLRPLHLLLTSNPSSFSDFVKKNGAKTLNQKSKIRNRFEEAAARLAC